MDYSQTHLEDFLKSNQSNRGLSGQQLVQSFMSTYNKTKKQQTKATPIQAIDENIEEDEDFTRTPDLSEPKH